MTEEEKLQLVKQMQDDIKYHKVYLPIDYVCELLVEKGYRRQDQLAKEILTKVLDQRQVIFDDFGDKQYAVPVEAIGFTGEDYGVFFDDLLY